MNNTQMQVQHAFRKDLKNVHKILENKILEESCTFDEEFSEQLNTILTHVQKSKEKLINVSDSNDYKNMIILCTKVYMELDSYIKTNNFETTLNNIISQRLNTLLKEGNRILNVSIKYHALTRDNTYKIKSFVEFQTYTSKIKTLFYSISDYYSGLVDEQLLDFEYCYKHKILKALQNSNLNSVFQTLEDVEEHRELLINNLLGNIHTEKDVESFRAKPLFKYRDLNKLAKSKGFDLVRHNGDHGIFKDCNGNVTVIPQGRDIKKGLSLCIQKSLANF